MSNYRRDAEQIEKTSRMASSNLKSRRCWMRIESRVNTKLNETKQPTHRPSNLRARRSLGKTKRSVSTNLRARNRVRTYNRRVSTNLRIRSG